MPSIETAKPLKYQQIENELREHIQLLSEGDKLPTERELASMFGCSVLTLRKGLANLEHDDWIVRRVGSGTFVNKLPRNEDLTDLTSDPIEGRIGCLMYANADDYGKHILQSTLKEGTRQQLDLRTSWIDSFGDEGQRIVRDLAEAGCSAVVLPWCPSDRAYEIQTFISKSPIPVSMTHLIPGLEQNCFERAGRYGVGDRKSTEGLCVYFQAMGKGHIAFLGPDLPESTIVQSKISAYACYMGRNGLDTHFGIVDASARSVNKLAERWAPYRGDLAVISYDDTHAIRLMTAMHKIGLSAPEDYVIIGVGDVVAGQFADPPLTTLKHNFDHIAKFLLRNAVALANDRLDQSDDPATQYLVIRGSCGAPVPFPEELIKQLGENCIQVDTSSLCVN